jgi:hypothetical protein
VRTAKGPHRLFAKAQQIHFKCIRCASSCHCPLPRKPRVLTHGPIVRALSVRHSTLPAPEVVATCLHDARPPMGERWSFRDSFQARRLYCRFGPMRRIGAGLRPASETGTAPVETSRRGVSKPYEAYLRWQTANGSYDKQGGRRPSHSTRGRRVGETIRTLAARPK